MLRPRAGNCQHVLRKSCLGIAEVGQVCRAVPNHPSDCATKAFDELNAGFEHHSLRRRQAAPQPRHAPSITLRSWEHLGKLESSGERREACKGCRSQPTGRRRAGHVLSKGIVWFGAMALVAGGSLGANMQAIHETSVLPRLLLPPRSTIGFLGSCQQEAGKHPGWNARVLAWLAKYTLPLLGFLGSCYLLIKRRI